MKNDTDYPSLCPCDSGRQFAHCCQPYIEQSEDAPTAETLMRSRYTAFVLLDEAYLRRSWHPDKCPQKIHLDDRVRWLGLKVKNTRAGGINDEIGEVEFVARSKVNGRARRLHEISRFTRVLNRWVYVDGKIID